ncbi:hypothetical protein ACVMFA_001141 [Bradyrhizobium liaoningense]
MNEVARSASAPGALVPWKTAASSGGACGSSSIASIA